MADQGTLPARDARRARALPWDRSGGPAGRAPVRARARAPAGRRTGLLEGARTAAGDLADLDGRVPARLRLRRAADRRRARLGRDRECPGGAPAALARDPAGG